MAHTTAHTASTSPIQWSTTRALRNALMDTKHQWAHDQLHHAADTKDIWGLAKMHKGHQVNTFPPLCDEHNTLVNLPSQKCEVLHKRFFLSNPRTIQTQQLNNPAPLPTREWLPIMVEEIAEALCTASDSSALGPSGVGYWLLEWAHTAHPDTLTFIFNLSLDSRTHL